MSRIVRITLGVLLLVSMPLLGQGNGGPVTGIVVDHEGAGLPGAAVTLSIQGAPDLDVVTAPGGVFRVSSVRAGTWVVRVRFPGLEAPEPQTVTVRAGEAAKLRFVFSKPMLREMVEVTARHDDVTTTQLRESAARDVGEAMVETPGIAKSRKGGIANDIVVRGLQRDNINVLIDGGRIYGACPNRMDSPAFHVDFSEIDHVEVTKGPYDIENQGSLGGVVNIITRKPETGFHGNAVLAAGSNGFLNPSVNASWGGSNFSALAGYSHRSADPYRDGNGQIFTEVANYAPGQADTVAFRVNTAWAKLYAKPSAAQTVELSYTRQEADHVQYPTLQMDAGWDNTDRLELGWQRTDDSSTLSRVRFRAYGSRVRHWMSDELRTTGLGTPLGWSMGSMADTSAIGAKADADLGSFRVGFEVLRRGWDITTQMSKMGYASQASIPDVVTTGAGLFATNHSTLAAGLGLDLGLRLDYSRTAADPALANTNLYYAYNSTRETSRSDTLPSASARLTWQAVSDLTLGLGVGHTVRVPDPAERYYALKRSGADWVGNPEVAPVRNTGADLQATWRHGRGAITAIGFYESLADWIAVHDQARVNVAPGVMNTAARSYTNLDATLWGAELELTHALGDRLFFAGSVSWTRGRKDTDPARLIYSPEMAEIPPLGSRVSLRWDTGKLYAAAEGVFAAAQDHIDTDLQEERTAGWGILNLKLGGEVAGFRVQGALNNVFDRQYQEHLSCTRDPFHAGVYVAEPGRSLTVNVIARF